MKSDGDGSNPGLDERLMDTIQMEGRGRALRAPTEDMVPADELATDDLARPPISFDNDPTPDLTPPGEREALTFTHEFRGRRYGIATERGVYARTEREAKRIDIVITEPADRRAVVCGGLDTAARHLELLDLASIAARHRARHGAAFDFEPEEFERLRRDIERFAEDNRYTFEYTDTRAVAEVSEDEAPAIRGSTLLLIALALLGLGVAIGAWLAAT